MSSRILARTVVTLQNTIRRMSSDVNASFEAARSAVGGLKQDPGNDVKLKLYALYKQGTSGQCCCKRPGMMDFVGRAKWDAWSALGSISQDEAKGTYVELVKGLVQKEGGEAQSVAEGTDSLAGGSILTKVDGKIFNIILNRPDKKNALTPDMYRAIGGALDAAGKNEHTVITVIKGEGDFYCSGNDLSNFTGVDMKDVPKMARDSRFLLQEFVDAWIRHPKPLVGLVHGPAIGISVTTLGLCDVVYASDKATFHTPFSSLGQSPEGASSFIFPRIMGLAKASEVLLFGRKLSAAEACERGLVAAVFPHDSFAAETEKRLQQYSELPPQSQVLSKKLIRGQFLEELRRTNEAECELLEERWQSTECINAIVKFFSAKSKI